MENEGRTFEDISSTGEAPESFLKVGYVLKGRYEILSVLGEGGFGITYKCQDITLGMPVAVKEYYPRGYVVRSQEKFPKVTYSATPDTIDFIKKAKERFIDEARVLAKFSGEIGIVNVRDYFEENNTAYIVMEFLNGKDLGKIVKEQGPMPADYVVQLFLPVMESLEKIHGQGLIHRDISPDNVRMVGNRLKLLDFGAARDFSYNGTKTMTVMLKRGYAPIEQYGGADSQGPWTDVYALCATLYYCITGTKPTESTLRWDNDRLQSPSQLGVAINPAIENVIMKGLSVSVKDRYQSVRALSAALNIALNMKAPVPNAKAKHKQAKTGKKNQADEKTARIDNVQQGRNAVQSREMLGAEDFYNQKPKNKKSGNPNDKPNNKSNKKSGGRGKIIIPIVAILLLVAIAAGVFAWRNGWFSSLFSSSDTAVSEESASASETTTTETTTVLPERKISGTIKQSSNLSVRISGATIKIYKEDELVQTVMSDASGEYVAHLNEGEYRAEVTVAGYKDYEFEFTITTDEDAARDIVLETVPTGTVTGYVYNDYDCVFETYYWYPDEDAKPISGANISVYKDDKEVLTAVSNSEGEYTVKLPEGTYLIKASSSGCVDSGLYVEVYENETNWADFVMTSGPSNEKATIKGTVYNSRTDELLEGATVTVKKYWPEPLGGELDWIENVLSETVQTTTTDSNGNYSLELPLGNYTVLVSKGDSGTELYETVSSKDVDSNHDFGLYVEYEPVEYTITLTWDNEQDLDIYYNSQYDYYDIIEHNFDDDGYGPESLTIKLLDEGPFYFDVYDNDGVGLAAANPKVKVEREGSVVGEYEFPATDYGTRWSFLEIYDDEITVSDHVDWPLY